MIIITDTECDAVPGSGISERVVFPEQRETLQIMYAAMLRLEVVEAQSETLSKAYGLCEQQRAAAMARIAELETLLVAARRAIGDHYAPDHCYATGPVTGDPYKDLVECPACSFIACHDALTKAQLKETGNG